jgi:hypothetical protein
MTYRPTTITRTGGREVIELNDDSSVGNLQKQVDQIQKLSTAPAGKSIRRLLFMWLRIYVHDRSDNTRVNLHIPLPIPLLGSVFSRQLSSQKALSLFNELKHSSEPSESLEGYLRSMMGMEFIRVDDDDTTVVIGLD